MMEVFQLKKTSQPHLLSKEKYQGNTGRVGCSHDNMPQQNAAPVANQEVVQPMQYFLN